MLKVQLQISPVGVGLWFLIRSYCLWLIVPLSTLVWVVASPWLATRGSLRQFVRWVDYNASVVLFRSVLQPFLREPYPPWAALNTVREFTTPLDFVRDFA